MTRGKPDDDRARGASALRERERRATSHRSRGKAALLLALAALLGAGTARAQIVSPAGRTLFNRTVMVRSFVRFDSFDEGVPGVRVRRLVNPYAVVWGPAPHLNVTWITPLIVVQGRDESDPGSDFTTTGTGDSAVFVRYDLWRVNVPGGFTRLSPEAGLRLPTGGAFGTGSTDPVGALIFSRVRDPHWLVADTQFTYSRAGNDGRRAGNVWNYDLAYLYRLLPREGLGAPSLLLVAELNGEHVEPARLGGQQVPDTGGDILFFSPGLEYVASNRLVLEASLPVRVHDELNGSQIRPAWSLILGFRWLM